MLVDKSNEIALKTLVTVPKLPIIPPNTGFPVDLSIVTVLIICVSVFEFESVNVVQTLVLIFNSEAGKAP